MDADSIPEKESMQSLTAFIVKPGDVVYTPPGVLMVDKVVNEDSISLLLSITLENIPDLFVWCFPSLANRVNLSVV